MIHNLSHIVIFQLFVLFLDFLVRAEISEGSLELVVKENYLRSRRAPCACKKMENQKSLKCIRKCHKTGHILI
jgi:hypothetical protein